MKKMGTRRNRFCAFLLAQLLALLCFALWPRSAYASPDAQVQAEEMSLEELGSLVHTSLDNLTNLSKSLTEGLESKSSEVEQWKTRFNDLVACSERTNKQLYDYETKLTASETKVKMLWKIVLTLLAGDLLFLGYVILEKKGIVNFI